MHRKENKEGTVKTNSKKNIKSKRVMNKTVVVKSDDTGNASDQSESEECILFRKIHRFSGRRWDQNEKAINNYFMFSAAVVTFCMMFIILESGEQIQSEGDKLYALVQTCNWHRWNQENRKFLQMFLLLVKKPLDISAYGIIQQDRILSMRIMKGLYSVFTFYGCMNK
ncbi:hypothetical protein JTB14_013453 [Gonioctena quinquepunctata]|nr:hypothetical protein JTB14_013453 [Gonioctena quinquepunctata]